MSILVKAACLLRLKWSCSGAFFCCLPNVESSNHQINDLIIQSMMWWIISLDWLVLDFQPRTFRIGLEPRDQIAGKMLHVLWSYNVASNFHELGQVEIKIFPFQYGGVLRILTLKITLFRVVSYSENLKNAFQSRYYHPLWVVSLRLQDLSFPKCSCQWIAPCEKLKLHQCCPQVQTTSMATSFVPAIPWRFLQW